MDQHGVSPGGGWGRFECHMIDCSGFELLVVVDHHAVGEYWYTQKKERDDKMGELLLARRSCLTGSVRCNQGIDRATLFLLSPGSSK